MMDAGRPGARPRAQPLRRHRGDSFRVADPELARASTRLMFRALRNLVRLLRIALTLARHDALIGLEKLGLPVLVTRLSHMLRRRNLPKRPGQRLAAALTDLGPSFVKLGQALSTRADLVGEDVAADLSQLQDRLAPFPAEEARATIAAQFGAPLDHIYGSFDDTPVAAASIAQVHFATTPDGIEVAVKVLRPGIEAQFERDIDLFMWLAEPRSACWPGCAA